RLELGSHSLVRPTYRRPAGRGDAASTGTGNGQEAGSLRGHTGDLGVRCPAREAGLSSQPVPLFADEGGEPQGVPGRRAQVPPQIPDDGGAAPGGDEARLEPPPGARWGLLCTREARLHRPEVL